MLLDLLYSKPAPLNTTIHHTSVRFNLIWGRLRMTKPVRFLDAVWGLNRARLPPLLRRLKVIAFSLESQMLGRSPSFSLHDLLWIERFLQFCIEDNRSCRAGERNWDLPQLLPRLTFFIECLAALIHLLKLSEVWYVRIVLFMTFNCSKMVF